MPQRPLKIKKRDITWNEIARHGQNVGIHNLDIWLQINKGLLLAIGSFVMKVNCNSSKGSWGIDWKRMCYT